MPPRSNFMQFSVADLRGRQKGHAPQGPNSFNFMQFWGKFGTILCWRPPPGKLEPPSSGKSWICHCFFLLVKVADPGSPGEGANLLLLHLFYTCVSFCSQGVGVGMSHCLYGCWSHVPFSGSVPGPMFLLGASLCLVPCSFQWVSVPGPMFLSVGLCAWSHVPFSGSLSLVPCSF